MKKVALITGASRGIGAATASHLAGQGYDICVNYRSDHAAAQQMVQELEKLGARAIAVQADVSNEEDVLRLFDAVDERFGALSALVNNAGILLPQMMVEQMTAERINTMLTTNVTNYFLCSREAVKRMAHKHGGQGGSIVNVSSAAARLGAAGEYVDYAASKAAVDVLTMGLSLEVADQGIRVNSVRPGFIDTEMHADGGEPNRLERLAPVIPMRRGGQASEVAAGIAWLLSNEASYVTGTFLDVSGGR